MTANPSVANEGDAALFNTVVFALDPAIPYAVKTHACRALIEAGAIEADSWNQANIVIAISLDFEGKNRLAEGTSIVTPVWLEHSVAHKKKMDPKYYSPDPRKFMSGIIATGNDDIPTSDIEAMSGAIAAYGGQWRHAFTKDVTHFMAMAPIGVKYDLAMSHKAHDPPLEVIVPAWFVDCLTFQQRIPTGPYSFPDPPVFHPMAPLTGEPPEGVVDQLRNSDRIATKNTLYRTLLEAGGEKMPKPNKEKASNIWGGQHVLLSDDLGMSEVVETGVQNSIIRNGGKVLIGEEHIAEADVYICRFRDGDGYDEAVNRDLTIGTLAWVFYVEQAERVTSPRDQLLHFPIPRYPIVGFEQHSVTISNYTGDSREYIKKLIGAAGAIFTPSFSQKNTIVIAAHFSGTKVEKAVSWDIPIVNHTWLEECFLHWKNLPIGGAAASRFSTFPAGLNFMNLLGERGFLGYEGVDPRKIVGQPPPLPENNNTTNSSNSRNGHQSALSSSDPNARPKATPLQNGGLGESSGGDAVVMPSVPSPVRARMPLSDAPDTSPLMTGRGEGSAGGIRPEAYRSGMAAMAPLLFRPPSPPSPPSSPPAPAGLTAVKASSSRGRLDGGVQVQINGLSDGSPLPKAAVAPPGAAVESKAGRPQSSSSGTKGKTRGKQKATTTSLEDDNDDDAENPTEFEPNGGPSKAAMARKDSKAPLSSGGRDKRSVHRASSPEAGPSEPKKINRTSSRMELVVEVPRPRPLGSSPRKSSSTAAVRRSSSPTTKTKTGAKKITPVVPLKRSIIPPVINMIDSSEDEVEAPKKTPPPSRKLKKGIQPDAAINVDSGSDEEEGPAGPSTAPSSKRKKENIAAKSSSHQNGGPSKQPPKGRERRGAAVAAATRLSDVVMPDVMKHQKDLKASHGDPRRMADPSSSKKRGRNDASDSDEEGERRSAQRRKSGGGGAAVKMKTQVMDVDGANGTDGSSHVESEEGESSEAEPAPKAKTVKKVRIESSLPENGRKTPHAPSKVKKVKLLTTVIELTDAQKSALKKMGANILPKEAGVAACTHLVANKINRTVKFLMALAQGKLIVNEDWIKKSIQAKMFLDEESFLLKDAEREKENNFTLQEAVTSVLSGKKLFAGHQFFITGKVKLDFETCKQIVEANGGKVEQGIKPRMFTPKGAEKSRHVVSCEEDRTEWARLLHSNLHLPIYTQEIITASALTQKIDWSGNRVKGSHDPEEG